jgi:hypothetical protein
MANTFELIASSAVGAGGSSSITFSSIPSTYTDLCLKLSLRSSNTAGPYDSVRILLNGNASNVLQMDVYGTGSAVGSEALGSPENNTISYTSNANNTANTFGNLYIYIANYASTSYTKAIFSDGVAETNSASSLATLTAGLWNSTSAINSVQVTPYSGSYTFTQYSSASLHGIKNS